MTPPIEEVPIDPNDKFLLSADAAIDVWIDLEEALAGKNGFGGDVAEIYAYRLVYEGAKRFTESARTKDTAAQAELAKIAGAHLTHIARRFAVQRKATIAIEEGRRVFRPLELSVEALPPFDWRLHLQVTPIEASAHVPSASAEDKAWQELLAGIEALRQDIQLLPKTQRKGSKESAMSTENLWDAINRYAVSIGGSPSTHVHGNIPRMEAVAEVEKAVAALVAESPGLDDTAAIALLGSKALRHPGFEAFRRQFYQFYRRAAIQTAIKSAWEAFQAGWEGA